MVELEAPQLGPVFHALSDSTRRQMLLELASGERTVSQLAQPFAMSLAAASKHIKVLFRSGLIQREVRGRAHLCRLDPGPLETAHEWLTFYERFWTARLDILDRLLREEDEQQSTNRNANKETRHEHLHESQRLRRAERAVHADDPAHVARPD